MTSRNTTNPALAKDPPAALNSALADASSRLVQYVSTMSNRFGVDLHPDSVHWAANEHVSDTVIAAVLLLHERSVEEIAPRLSPLELGKAIELVGLSPRLYPHGILETLDQHRSLRASVLTPKTQPELNVKGHR
jgi:hypothetical protein